MDFKYAYKLPDGDTGERTVTEKSQVLATIKALDEIANFEDVDKKDIKMTLIGMGDKSKGTYYECEGCT